MKKSASKPILSFLLTLMVGCAPDLTKDFVGSWSLASGTLSEDCQGMRVGKMHSSGDLRLKISASNNETLAIQMFYAWGTPPMATCDLAAAVEDERTARINAKACNFAGSSYSLTEGLLGLTPSKALMLTLHAEVGSKETCTRVDDCTLVPE